jgi:hypothetical protein
MSNVKTAQSLTGLPTRRASDLKKVGWGGLNRDVQSHGQLVVTYHDRPQAVILSVEAYQLLQQQARSAEKRTQSAIEELNSKFDQQLSSLRGKAAGPRLRAVIRKPAKLGGKLKAGSSY